MKKINIIIRIFLYSLPLLYGVYLAVVFSKTGSTDAITLYNNIISGLTDWCEDFPYFRNFYSWFNTNISNGYVYINNAFAYCCYLIMIEFVILFKNVLMYLFNVANEWLEKGVQLGK